MRSGISLFPAAALLMLFVGTVCADEPSPVSGPVLMAEVNKPFTGDFDRIIERGYIRILVEYSQTNYFVAVGRERGYEYELFQEYGTFLNRGRKRPILIVYVPMPFDELFEALISGRGDVAAGSITITPERQQTVSFTNPYLSDVDEVIVSAAGAARVGSLKDLSGKSVYVLRGSSYAEHLASINRTLTGNGSDPIEIIESAPYLSIEDILEMVNAGIAEYTVCDAHTVRLWSNVLKNLTVRGEVKISTGGQIAWAVRPDNPVLRDHLNTFIKDNKKGTLIGNILFKRYYQDTRWIHNPISPAEFKKLQTLKGYFEKYAAMYGFDWLVVAAQGYQESRLDQSVKSKAGAIGIMQVLPSTARDKSVNIPDITNAENNIHAGIKYLAHLRDTWFNEPGLTPEARLHFSLAAYNAGPGNVERFRKCAAEKGYDPNLWYGNAARCASEMIGMEPVRYVANIHKYYVAYNLITKIREKKTRHKYDTNVRIN